MQRPETKPTEPSTQMTFRWFRRSAVKGFAGCSGLKKRISPPARSSSRKRRRGVDQQPNQSQRTRTLTPAAARSASSEAKLLPQRSARKMYISMWTLRRAARIACSQAG
jgi:hypothetical protein